MVGILCNNTFNSQMGVVNYKADDNQNVSFFLQLNGRVVRKSLNVEMVDVYQANGDVIRT